MAVLLRDKPFDHDDNDDDRNTLLTLSQLVCYTHAAAPVILYAVVFTALLLHIDLIFTGDSFMISFLDYWHVAQAVPEQVWAPFIRMLSLSILQSRVPFLNTL